jgi:hypothetical protein
VLEFGKILVDRCGEVELALLDQHHGGLFTNKGVC